MSVPNHQIPITIFFPFEMYCFNFCKMPSLQFENLCSVQMFFSHTKHNFMKSFRNWQSGSVFFPMIKERKSGMGYVKML